MTQKRLKRCNFCTNAVPKGGQCNSCGFVDGLQRPPSDQEYMQARDINDQHGYEQFSNIDMLLLE